MSEETISEEQVLHNELSFEINQELIHLMKRIVELQRANEQLREQLKELKHIMYVIRDDNGLKHLWCKDMILDWLGSDSNE